MDKYEPSPINVIFRLSKCTLGYTFFFQIFVYIALQNKMNYICLKKKENALVRFWVHLSKHYEFVSIYIYILLYVSIYIYAYIFTYAYI